MKDYIIRTECGIEKCIVADSVAIDIVNKKATFWHKYRYTEYNGEYCNYICKNSSIELPLGGIATIGVIRYDNVICGELEIIYDASKEVLYE